MSKDNILERVAAKRSRHKISVYQLAKITGIPKDRIYSWDRFGSKPKHDDRLILEKWLADEHIEQTNGNTDKNENLVSVPVYDVEFTAGFTEIIKDSSPQILAMLSIPEVQGCDYVIRAKGDSMVDYINDRDWIGIKEINDRSVIAYSYPYAIVTSDLNLLKILKKSKDDSKVILHSKNEFYEDFEIEKTKIIELYIIKTVIPFSKIKTFM